jgi:hypothetical protein
MEVNVALEKYYESCQKLKQKEDFDQNAFLRLDYDLNCGETYETDEDIIDSVKPAEEIEEEQEELATTP